MNTHDKAQELIDDLLWVRDDSKVYDGIFHMHERKETFVNLTKAIEAIKLLQLIADVGGTSTDEGLSCNGSWCAEQARSWLESLK